MKKILFDIYSDKELSGILAFKGGTALYLFYNLPRFSIDLDFNLLDPAKEKIVLEKIKTIAERYGTVKDASIKYYTIFTLLSYGEQDHNIKIEISRRGASSYDKYEIKSLVGLPVLTLAQDIMAGQKLVAIRDRKKMAMRDLFDARVILKYDWPVSEDVIRDKTGKSKTEYFKKLADHLEKLGELNILQGLGELIDAKQKQEVKANLVKELIFLLRIKSE